MKLRLLIFLIDIFSVLNAFNFNLNKINDINLHLSTNRNGNTIIKIMIDFLDSLLRMKKEREIMTTPTTTKQFNDNLAFPYRLKS